MSWYAVNQASLRPGGRPGLSPILPNLLIGEYPRPEDAVWLKTTHGVTAVLNLQDEADLASKDLDARQLEQAYRECGLRYQQIAVPDCDTEVLGQRLEDILARLGELLDGGERVYLHCNGGLNRAPTVAIAYLHARGGLSLADSRDFVKSRRPCAPYMRLLEAHFGVVAGAPRAAARERTRA